jgi:hypothetical protein
MDQLRSEPDLTKKCTRQPDLPSPTLSKAHVPPEHSIASNSQYLKTTPREALINTRKRSATFVHTNNTLTADPRLLRVKPVKKKKKKKRKKFEIFAQPWGYPKNTPTPTPDEKRESFYVTL